MKLGIDIVGNIAILKFDRDVSVSKKKKVAEDFLKEHKSVRTVLEKVGKFSGRLRTHKTKFVAGEKNKEALYKENGCEFRFNVDSCYFSGRLSSDRKEIASKVKKKENVLVMFGGVGPYAITIGKTNKPKRVFSVELGRECNKYAKINVKRNKLESFVEVVQGDVRKKVPLLKENAHRTEFHGATKSKTLSSQRTQDDFVGLTKSKTLSSQRTQDDFVGLTKSKTLSSQRTQDDFVGFDRIVMSRPQLKDSFLDVAFKVIKKEGIIHYYGFYQEKDILELKSLIKSEAKKAKKKIRIQRIKKVGDIGPYRFRWRVDFKVLN